jgi:predicted  nucleic acid-binding Zn-ribbon protein
MDEFNLHPPMNDIIKILLQLQTLEINGKATPGHEKQAAELRAKVPPPILAHYDRLVARGKKGVALIRNQSSCSACHISVPRNVVLTLMHNADVQLCESCGRYLYLPEPTASPEPVAAPKKISKPRKPKAQLQPA